MNPQPAAEFDPDEELTRLGDAEQELYGLPLRIFFYLIETCQAIQAFATPAFSIEAVLDPPGCLVEFIVRQAFWIDTSPSRVKLWTASGDDAETRSQYLVHDGDASDPKAWENMLMVIGRVEHFDVLIPHADKLRLMWTEWFVEQNRRGDQRDW